MDVQIDQNMLEYERILFERKEQGEGRRNVEASQKRRDMENV